MPTAAPNVVLLVLDTARADALEPYGAPRGATPVLRDVAGRGVAIRDVFAPANWTLPSHVSMFTGELPRAIGVGQAPAATTGGCRPILQGLEQRYLPAVLRAAGYSTRAVSANLWISDRSGFGLGFDEFHELAGGRNGQIHDHRLRTRARWAVEAVRARVDDGAAQAAEIIERWLSEPQRRPFFWFVNLVECHSPYLPPRPYSDRGVLDRMRAAADARRYLTLMGIWRASTGLLDVPPDVAARMRRLYAASVRQLDDWVERLLGGLERAGLLDDTLVVVTSDHGENLGEGGRLGHAFWLDDRLLRVPLVAMGPADLGTGPVTSLVDLPALLAEAVGLRDHPWEALPGARRVAIAQSDALSDPSDPRFARARDEFGFDDYALWRMATSSTAASDGTLKLVREGGEDWLYDLVTDPLEEGPRHVDGRVAAEYGERFSALAAAVDAVHGQVPAMRVAPVDLSVEAWTDVEDRMRLLGYL